MTETESLRDNPTRALIAEAVTAGKRDVLLDVNPAFKGLAAVLNHGVPGNVVITFTAAETATQGNGVVGGGTLASMLDSAMATAVLSSLKAGETCATISLTVNMQRAAKPGELVAEAKVEHLGKRIAFAQAQLFDCSRRLIASGSCSLAILAHDGT